MDLLVVMLWMAALGAALYAGYSRMRRNQLIAKGGAIKLGARVWLDHEDSRPGKSSVQIFVDSRLTG